jgi:ATP-dependent Clp protease protease subunit
MFNYDLSDKKITTPEMMHPAAMAMAGAYGSMSAAPPMQRIREMTLDELLLENRVIFLVGEINYNSATRVIMQMLHLQNQKKDTDINLYINSPGGAVILATGAAGKRFILPHAKVMIHQPYGGVTGQASDVKIQAEEILRSKRAINEILSRHTGKPVEQVEEDSERDRYFSAQEAKEYGLVDEVIEYVKESEKK